jgi:DNA repair protein RecN (Recombination protein N)
VLEELNVKDFGIIDEITWRPTGGLNVITGETGAGKSLVVDAVEALLSGQVDEEDIRHGSEEARVEGIFSLGENKKGTTLQQMLTEKGLASGDDTLVLTCDFRRQGRTTPRVNRQAVSRSLLKDIGGTLVDIHGQSQHLSLLNKEQHREFLDAYAHVLVLRHDFGLKTAELHQIEREIEVLSRSERELTRQQELLRFQIEEIGRAKLTEDEEAALQKELVLLTSAEKLKAAAYEVYRVIYGDENTLESSSALDRANEAMLPMKQIAGTDPSLKAQLAYLEEVVHGLEELARDVHAYGDNLSFEPQRFEEVQARLELIRGLKRKYGGSVTGVLRYQAKAESELEGLTTSGERREKLGVDRGRLRTEMGNIAVRLSRERARSAKNLASAVKKELAELNLGRVDFDIAITQAISPEGLTLPDGRSCRYSPTGIDDVVFMASTNPGEPLKPLDRIASTGEISRFLLALKSALAGADTVPVLIFDEIDIGIGGRSGEVIGQKLWNLSRHHQVICVTHLPQIAAFADAQYRVSKQATGRRTISSIESIKGEARLTELAVMIAGPSYTPAALNTAAELIVKAEKWKKSPAKVKGA